jgi:hypothetical protein
MDQTLYSVIAVIVLSAVSFGVETIGPAGSASAK